ncbi:MAG: hypothetical protein KMY53_14330 [Desulfarculus sp.]|nr:hypothetical protein [Pseudomonadota bacterium]MBV1739341.1 hypothetical protein [Desulfarculus sp.]
MLAIERGVMSHRELSMLDEPSSSMAPIMMQGIFKAIASIIKLSTTMLNIGAGHESSDCVLENGEINLSDPAD